MGMRMAKAPQEHVDTLRRWMQFNDELCKIDPTNEFEWNGFKEDWEDEEDFVKIIKHCEDDRGFTWDYFMDYYQSNISWIHMRVILGFEVMVDNVCDPDLDYLEFKPEIKKFLGNEPIVKFKAKRIDTGDWVTGFFTKKKVGRLIVPVIEVYKEWDNGDYMETYEIDGATLTYAD